MLGGRRCVQRLWQPDADRLHDRRQLGPCRAAACGNRAAWRHSRTRSSPATPTTPAAAISRSGYFSPGPVTGTYNLIGPGGSGGIEDGTDGNIVLTSLAGLGLTPLGDYGGPTLTMALVPGSAAIGAGTAVDGITTDQRGLPLNSPVPDIGAFQTQPVSPVFPTSPFVVTSTADDGSAGTLRWAVAWADLSSTPSEIDFDLGSATATIALSQGVLDLNNTAGPDHDRRPGGEPA